MQALQMLAPYLFLAFVAFAVLALLVAAGAAAYFFLRERGGVAGADMRAIRKQIAAQERKERLQAAIKKVAVSGGYEVEE